LIRWLIRIGLVMLVALLATAGYGWHRLGGLDRPSGTAEGTVAFEVAPGSGFDRIVEQLHAEGIVSDPLLLRFYGRWTGIGGRLKAGSYTIDRTTTPRALLDMLEAGPETTELRVTIPEGFNRWQIADLLARKGLADRAELLDRIEREDLEGRLFPDTYRFRPDASLDTVVQTLTARFEAVMGRALDAVPADRRPSTTAERRRLLVLASLIEKEARTDRDRRLVSRVFQNRLAKGMKLQTDPTCVYDARWYRETPHPRYCRDPKNRYSTYMIKALPPGPIANPGRAAIEAALTPADGPKAAKLLYFVARRDGSGEHHFSETYAEHQRAVNRYLKGR